MRTSWRRLLAGQHGFLHLRDLINAEKQNSSHTHTRTQTQTQSTSENRTITPPNNRGMRAAFKDSPFTVFRDCALSQFPCQVVAPVSDKHLMHMYTHTHTHTQSQSQTQMTFNPLHSRFISFALLAAREALTDAGLIRTSQTSSNNRSKRTQKHTSEGNTHTNAHILTKHERERTGVCIGSGMGSLSDIYDMSLRVGDSTNSTATNNRRVAFGSKRVSPYFIPRILINLAAGTICLSLCVYVCI